MARIRSRLSSSNATPKFIIEFVQYVYYDCDLPAGKRLSLPISEVISAVNTAYCCSWLCNSDVIFVSKI